ncbi:hypothetical protein, partial [Pigmentiphaga daeguensis]|uniref:hypothetical protein n=1 Tax=Pigmentiphaga daeguensis TaxID=414049 RepID=UPI0031DF0643
MDTLHGTASPRRRNLAAAAARTWPHRRRSAQVIPGLIAVAMVMATCRIPDDYIDSRRYPLFMARAVLQALIEEHE